MNLHLHPSMRLIDAAALARAQGGRLVCRAFRIAFEPLSVRVSARSVCHSRSA